MFKRKRKLGRHIDEIKVGEKLVLTETIEDHQLLLYLGLTDDANPLYIQHDFASQTPFERPIVPPIMLTGMITSALSKYIPGPGSHLLQQSIDFFQPVFHYEHIHFVFEVKEVNTQDHFLLIETSCHNNQGELVLTAASKVSPAKRINNIDARTLDNF